MPDAEGVSIVVPVYNEEGAIASCLARLQEVAQGLSVPSEILVVDDGSTDGTAQALAQAQQEHLLAVITHPANLGYGAALRSGMRRARYPVIVITDADGTYPSEVIPELVRRLANADMVVAARTGADVSIPLIRRPAKWVLNVLANYLAGQRIPDLNSGLRAFRLDVARKFFHILPSGFSFTTTITLAFLTNGFVVDHVPVDYARRTGRSKFHPLRDTANMTALIVRTVMYFKPLKVFVPASVLLAVAAVVVFLASWWGGRIMDFTVTALLMTSVQLLALGLLADLIDKRSLRE